MSDESQYYKVRVRGTLLDVYDVLKAYGVTCPATQHAIKKLLRRGRGDKNRPGASPAKSFQGH